MDKEEGRFDEELKYEGHPAQKDLGKFAAKWFDQCGGWIAESFALFRDNLFLLLSAGFLTVALSLISGLILAGPLLLGLCSITLSLIDKKSPQPAPGDVFKGFSQFAQGFLFFLVWTLVLALCYSVLLYIPVIGPIVAYFLAATLHAFIQFGPFLIVDKKRSFWQASLESAYIVRDAFVPLWIYSFAALLVAALGGVFFIIGSVVTLPLYCSAIAVVYRHHYNPKPRDLLQKMRKRPTA